MNSLTQTSSHLAHYLHEGMGLLPPAATASKSKLYYEFLEDDSLYITQSHIGVSELYSEINTLTHCPLEYSSGNIILKIISKGLMRIWEAMTKCTVDSLSQAKWIPLIEINRRELCVTK